MKPNCYGGIIFDDQGRILLRKPTGGWGGYAWTFAKGSSDPGETPQTTALREVLEETGYRCEIISPIPGSFESDTCWTSYFLMRPITQVNPFDHETEQVRWVTVDEARLMLAESSSVKGKARDLAALAAAIAMRR
jgi:8-oxo-dGTP diphosphatase